jgi:hypothetical protein
MHAVVEIDVGNARTVPPDELAGARSLIGVTSFVAFDQIGLGLNHDPGTSPPDQFGSD